MSLPPWPSGDSAPDPGTAAAGVAGRAQASRRRLLGMVAAAGLSLAPAAAQDATQRKSGIPDAPGEEDPRLPNGKSQKDAIAQAEHEKALKDAESLAALANQLREDLEKAGNYTVPVSALRKTEEIEKLARRIRGRLHSP